MSFYQCIYAIKMDHSDVVVSMCLPVPCTIMLLFARLLISWVAQKFTYKVASFLLTSVISVTFLTHNSLFKIQFQFSGYIFLQGILFLQMKKDKMLYALSILELLFLSHWFCLPLYSSQFLLGAERILPYILTQGCIILK